MLESFLSYTTQTQGVRDRNTLFWPVYLCGHSCMAKSLNKQSTHFFFHFFIHHSLSKETATLHSVLKLLLPKSSMTNLVIDKSYGLFSLFILDDLWCLLLMSPPFVKNLSSVGLYAAAPGLAPSFLLYFLFLILNAHVPQGLSLTLLLFTVPLLPEWSFSLS